MCRSDGDANLPRAATSVLLPVGANAGSHNIRPAGERQNQKIPMIKSKSVKKVLLRGLFFCPQAALLTAIRPAGPSRQNI
jgi:hypothetical protein